MIRTDKRIRLCLTLLVCNLVFIWGNSLLPGEVSGAISDAVKAFLARFLPIGGPEEENGNHILRKLAHFTEFTALGMVLTWLFAMLKKRKFLPLCCGAAAACVDETIQIFVPDRGPSIRDVGIDTCGVALGIILLTVGHTLLKKKLTYQSLEDDL